MLSLSWLVAVPSLLRALSTAMEGIQVRNAGHVHESVWKQTD